MTNGLVQNFTVEESTSIQWVNTSKGKFPKLLYHFYFCLVWIGMNPAGTWCKNGVVLTSMRRDYVTSTSIQHHFGTKCPLGNLKGKKICCSRCKFFPFRVDPVLQSKVESQNLSLFEKWRKIMVLCWHTLTICQDDWKVLQAADGYGMSAMHHGFLPFVH